MKRKIISVLLIFISVISLLSGINITSFNSLAAELFKSGDYEYALNVNDEIIIKTYLGKDREVVIPYEIEGKKVAGIGEYAFNGQKRLVSIEEGFENHPNSKYNNRIRKIYIPSTVTEIGEYAFADMKNLKEVVIDEGVRNIDSYAFFNCPNLESVDLPNSLEEFILDAFDETAVEEIVLGSSAVELDLYGEGNSNIRRIVCNSETTVISNVVLSDDSVLEEIVINGRLERADIRKSNIKRIVCNGGSDYNTVIRLQSYGFKYKSDYNGNNVVFYSENTENDNLIESGEFRYCLNKKSEAVITRYIGGKSEVSVPPFIDGHKVTGIAPLAFSSLEAEFGRNIRGNDWLIDKNLLIKVTLPDSVEAIGNYAFAYNLSLVSVNIPHGIISIPEECFYGCKSLAVSEIPENVKKICSGAFEECIALETVIMNGVNEIEGEAFKFCESLKSVEMNNAITVSDRAFYRCINLTDVMFSEKLNKIGTAAFYDCNIGGVLDLSFVLELGANSFDGTKVIKVILNDNLTVLEYGVFQSCTNLEEINFPSKLICIKDCCFRGASLNEAVFPETLKEIGALAFDGCRKLSVIVLPRGIEKIGSFAFEYASIEEIVIPESLKIIGYRAFGNCQKLETLYFNAINCTVEPYMDVPQDLDLNNLRIAAPFYGCNIKNIYLGEGITVIGGGTSQFGAFEDCAGIESVIIPDSVSRIGAAAFKNCSSLKTAVVSDSVTEIADDAFDGCDNLTILCFKNSYVYSYAQAQGIKVSTFVVAPIPNQIYTGRAITPEVSVSFMGDSLYKNIDFGVSYANNINVGDAEVTVKGKGDFKSFSSKIKFTIITRNISLAFVANISDQAYTGNEVTPSLTVTDGSKLLREGKDYSVLYSNNKKEGTASVKIIGKGNYSGYTSAEFQIVKMSKSESFFGRIGSALSSFLIRFALFFKGLFV